MRDRQKTIDALRRLAERPGTPAEGATARKKLAELEAMQPKVTEPAPGFQGMRYVRFEGEIDVDALREILGVKRAARPKSKPVVTWEDMEGQIRRHIFRRGQGDED